MAESSSTARSRLCVARHKRQRRQVGSLRIPGWSRHVCIAWTDGASALRREPRWLVFVTLTDLCYVSCQPTSAGSQGAPRGRRFRSHDDRTVAVHSQRLGVAACQVELPLVLGVGRAAESNVFLYLGVCLPLLRNRSGGASWLRNSGFEMRLSGSPFKCGWSVSVQRLCASAWAAGARARQRRAILRSSGKASLKSVLPCRWPPRCDMKSTRPHVAVIVLHGRAWVFHVTALALLLREMFEAFGRSHVAVLRVIMRVERRARDFTALSIVFFPPVSALA